MDPALPWMLVLGAITIACWHIVERPRSLRLLRRKRKPTTEVIPLRVRTSRGMGRHLRRLHDLASAQLGLLLFFICALATADYIDALIATTLIVSIIGFISVQKYRYIGFRLTHLDIKNLFDASGLFLIRNYTKELLLLLLILSAAIAGAYVLAQTAPAAPMLRQRVLIGALIILGCLAISYRAFGKFLFPPWTYGRNRFHFVGFFALALPGIGPNSSFHMEQVGPVAIAPGEDVVPHTAERYPHIIVIQHESTFPPDLYGLPVQPHVAEFFAPADGISGKLKVDIFGGGSWLTEFAFQTGLSSRCFGSQMGYLFHKGANRFRNSITQYLADAGYATSLFLTVGWSFYSYNKFYKSIGIERIFSGKDLNPDPRETQSDEIFFAGVISEFRKVHRQQPQLLVLLTNFNHSPHRKPRPMTLESARSFGMKMASNPEYAEYYARLEACARAYGELKSALTREFPEESFVIVRYGDHQPEFVLRMDETATRDGYIQQQTFYTIEGINYDLDATVGPDCDPLDAAFLGTLALKAARLPLDPVRTVHASLIDECGSAYFEQPSERKEAFHRLLIDRGLVRVDA